jgi:hypothetical protein
MTLSFAVAKKLLPATSDSLPNLRGHKMSTALKRCAGLEWEGVKEECVGPLQPHCLQIARNNQSKKWVV